MDKMRSVNTRFWIDNWVLDLDPIEKLLFIYLLTNQATNLTGIYELHLRKMAFETGIEREMVQKILTRFEKDKKMIYKHGFVFILNFTKHQSYNSKMLINIQQTVENLPDKVKNDSLLIPLLKGIYSLYIPLREIEMEMEREIEMEIENEIEKKSIHVSQKKFIAPSLEEVKQYFVEKGYKEETAIKAWNYYTEGGWKDSQGNRVKNWKQKMNGVWFKDENKAIQNKGRAGDVNDIWAEEMKKAEKESEEQMKKAKNEQNFTKTD